MKSEVTIVTPDMAKQWLQCNTTNRRYRPEWAAQLRGAIERGEWITTHQGIALDEVGNLLDGQHRLGAIVAAGVPVKIMVTCGLPKAAFTVMDRGRNRSLRDTTGHSTNVIAVISMINLFLSGQSITASRQAWTHDQYMETYNVFGTKTEYIAAHSFKNRRGVAQSGVLTAAVVHLVNGHDVAGQIKALNLMDFDAMTPSVQALTRQIIGGTIKGRDWMTARAWRALDPKNSGSTQIRVIDPLPLIAEMRTILIREFEQKRMAA